VASSSFISLAEAESRSAPIGTAWPSTTTIHPCRLWSFQGMGPFLVQANLTDLVAPIRTGT
jgi:hypothetical protein